MHSVRNDTIWRFPDLLSEKITQRDRLFKLWIISAKPTLMLHVPPTEIISVKPALMLHALPTEIISAKPTLMLCARAARE
jgi:hypothetical protein